MVFSEHMTRAAHATWARLAPSPYRSTQLSELSLVGSIIDEGAFWASAKGVAELASVERVRRQAIDCYEQLARSEHSLMRTKLPLAFSDLAAAEQDAVIAEVSAIWAVLASVLSGQRSVLGAQLFVPRKACS